MKRLFLHIKLILLALADMSMVECGGLESCKGWKENFDKTLINLYGE